MLNNVKLFGPDEALSVRLTLLASQLFPLEISWLAWVCLRHMTAEALCLFERPLLADWADEDIAFLEGPKQGLCLHQATGGTVTLLLDLLGTHPFGCLNQDVKVEGCLLLLNWSCERLRKSLALGGLHSFWRLLNNLLSEIFILFDF